MGTETRVGGAASAGGAAAIAGAGVALLATAGVHAAAPGIPFPPVAVAEAIVRGAPGTVATFAIERLGHLAQPLLVITTTVGSLVAAWMLGRLLPRSDARIPGGPTVAAFLLGAPIVAVAVVAMRPGSTTAGRVQYALVIVAALLLGSAVTAWRWRRLLELRDRTERRDTLDPSRREVVLGIVVGAAGLAVGWTGLGRALLGPSDPGGSPLRVRVSTQPRVKPDPAFDAIPGLSPAVTPTRDFYVVDTALFDPIVNGDTWSLSVGGLVDRSFEISYEELLEQSMVEFVSTLECISNEVGGDLISTARWTGVPVRALLERAGVRDGAIEVVATSVDGYADSIPLRDAMWDRAIVVLGMNGVTLPRAHGFPARLLVPGLYGMKQPKWLGSIELVDRPFVGYWERRGWSKAAIVKTMSRVDAHLSDGTGTVVAGVAFAGDRGVSRVEVSLDGGATWADAELEAPPSRLSWRRWRFALDPSATAGTTLVVRGIDGDGRVQEQEVAPPHPDGASGYHTVDLG